MDEREPESAPPSLLATLRRAGETLVDTLRNRVELFAVEMEEEKHWLIATLLWTAAAILFGMLAIIFVTLTIVVLCPEPARPWVLGGFCVLYVALALSAFSGLRKKLRDKPPPLAGTVGELKKDLAWIQSQK